MGATLIFITMLSDGTITEHSIGEYEWDQCIEVLQNTSHKISHGPENGFSSFVTCKNTLYLEQE